MKAGRVLSLWAIIAVPQLVLAVSPAIGELAHAETHSSAPRPAPSQDASAPTAAGAVRGSAVVSVPRSQRAQMFYRRRWGIEDITVRSLSSGSSLEFRYRVVIPDKAQVLNDKRVKPYLIDEKTGTRLEVPTMEKIGELRQTATPEEGRQYWMVFSNSGRVVKRGQRVDVLIGPFRADGLTVE
jgi:hypothetical protein